MPPTHFKDRDTGNTIPGQNVPRAKSILLVEDEPLIAMNEAYILEDNGYYVTQLHSGEEAISFFKNGGSADLVLMDIDLGKGMDGTEAAEKILAEWSVPIVFLTSHNEKEVVEKVKKITRYGYVLKNAGDFVLISSIEMAFELFEAHRNTKESESRFKLLFHTAPIGIFRYDTGFTIQECNEPFIRLLQSKRNKLIGLDMRNLNDTRVLESISAPLAGEQGFYEGSYKATTSDAEIWITMHTAPILDSGLSIIGGIGIVQNITERKFDENQIKNLLEEKELLLREVHHRIKNNMLTISSLLTLQAQSLTDRTAMDALIDSAHRIQSMMHIYDRLYRSNDYSNIDFSGYISNLIDDIINAYTIDSDRVRIEKDIQDIRINTQNAFPVGLIVNELVSNALKYAFKDSGRGVLEVCLGIQEDGMIELSVRDSGAGIPDSVDLENPKTFGLNLVNLMVRQIQGNLRYVRGDGSRFTLNFSAADPGGREKG